MVEINEVPIYCWTSSCYNIRQALSPQTPYSMSSVVAGEEGSGRADVDSVLLAQGGPPHCHYHQRSESQGHGHHWIFWQVPCNTSTYSSWEITQIIFNFIWIRIKIHVVHFSIWCLTYSVLTVFCTSTNLSLLKTSLTFIEYILRSLGSSRPYS